MVKTNELKFKRIIKKFAPRSQLLRAEPLTGGVSAEVTLLETADSGGKIQKMIVRRHGPRDLAQNPNIAADEFKLLKLLHSSGIPAAQPYFLDQSCELFPTPYLVVEYIEGKPEFEPVDLSSFISQFAAYLARLHQLKADLSELSFLPDQTEVWTQRIQNRPTKLDATINEGRIRDALQAVWPLHQHNPTVLLHGDFWPGNAIWRDGQLVAMIDWEDSALGDPLVDLAVSRLDMLWAFGMDAMHEYTRRYQALNPIDFTNLPYWDLCIALRPANQISSWAPDEAAKNRMRERHALFVQQAFENIK